MKSNRTTVAKCIIEIFVRNLSQQYKKNKLCGRPPQYAPPSHVTLTFDLLTLKVVSESRVTCATSVPILVFLGLSVLDLGQMYVTGQTTDRQTQTSDAHHRLMPLGGGITMAWYAIFHVFDNENIRLSLTKISR